MDYVIIDLKTRKVPYNWHIVQTWNQKGEINVRQIELETDNSKIQLVYSMNNEDKRNITIFNQLNKKTYHTKLDQKEITRNEELIANVEEKLKLTSKLEKLLEKVI